MTAKVIQFPGGSSPPPLPPVEPMGPRMAAFFLRGVCERLDRLESTLDLLQKSLEAEVEKGAGLRSYSSLSALCSAEVEHIYADVLLPVVHGLEANCESDAAPDGGKPAA